MWWVLQVPIPFQYIYHVANMPFTIYHIYVNNLYNMDVDGVVLPFSVVFTHDLQGMCMLMRQLFHGFCDLSQTPPMYLSSKPPMIIITDKTNHAVY